MSAAPARNRAQERADEIRADREQRLVLRACPVCGRKVPVVNHAVEAAREVGYLGRHWRPGLPRTSKCRGSFGGWVGR